MNSLLSLLFLLSFFTHGAAKVPLRSSETILKNNYARKKHTNFSFNNDLLSRGGACSDSKPELFLKIAISAALETGTLLGVIAGTKKLSEKISLSLPDLFGLPILQWLGLIAIIFASSLFGSFVDGGLSAASNQVLSPNTVPDPDWYDNLVKPSWNPPDLAFPIMWLIVSKPTQLIAVSKIIKTSYLSSTLVDDAVAAKTLPIPILAVYCAHLSLGDAWNKVFFGLQCKGRGAAVITAFFGVLLMSTYLFFTVDSTAGKFMLPTCGWVFVAASLNWNIFLNNKKKGN